MELQTHKKENYNTDYLLRSQQDLCAELVFEVSIKRIFCKGGAGWECKYLRINREAWLFDIERKNVYNGAK